MIFLVFLPVPWDFVIFVLILKGTVVHFAKSELWPLFLALAPQRTSISSFLLG